MTCLLPLWSVAQHTFSIVAIDTVTGEIGSAGATCLNGSFGGGALIISDIITGVGAVHTQSFWNASNQANARTRVEAGDNAQQVLDWVVANDAQNTPNNRQYGAVTIDTNGQVTAAAFTGIDCFDYKNHLVGPNYAIQGNILLGQEILDSMEAGFLHTQGSLADKLMAAMQGANVPGADTRCLPNGTSSLTSFLRVSKPSDIGGVYYLDLRVTNPPTGAEPIDELQALFDAWTPPNCDISIDPAAVSVLDTTLTVSASAKAYLVCPGDSIVITGIQNKVYLLGEGSYCKIGSLSASNEVYVVAGATFDGTGSVGTMIYAEPGANVVDPGLGQLVTLCDSITYLNLGDFPNACVSATSIRSAIEEKVAIVLDSQTHILRVSWQQAGLVREVVIIDINGRIVTRQDARGAFSTSVSLKGEASTIFVVRVIGESGIYNQLIIKD